MRSASILVAVTFCVSSFGAPFALTRRAPAVGLVAPVVDLAIQVGSTDRSLERLEAQDPAERERGQRELADVWGARMRGAARVAISPSQPAEALDRSPGEVLARELSARLDGMGSEARRRISVVLSNDDALLGVAIGLATVAEPRVRQVGIEGLRGQLDRWTVSAFDEPDTAVFDIPRQKLDLPQSVQDLGGFHVELDPNLAGGIGAFDRFDRLGNGPVPVVVDPAFAEQMLRRPRARIDTARVGGTWVETLEQLCLIHGGAFQLQGFRYASERRPSDDLAAADEDAAPGAMAPLSRRPRPWIHVVAAGSTDIARVGRGVRATAGDVIQRWCLEAAREGNLARQGAAARALAGLDWPASTLWLEQRWRTTGDVSALEGLLAAAARGHVAPSLQRVDVLRSVLALMDRDAAEVAALRAAARDSSAGGSEEERRTQYEAAKAAFESRLRRFAVGLAELSPLAVGANGAPLLPVVFEGFDAAGPSGRWLRLVIAEGFGLSSEPAARAARAVVSGRVEARSVRQALRALLVVEPMRSKKPLVVGDAAALFRGDARGLGLELGLLGATVGGTSDAWVLPLSADRQILAELLVWGALLAAAPERPETPPRWLQRAARAAARLSLDDSVAAGRGPFERAREAASGDLTRDVEALVAWVDPALGRDEDRAALRRAALRAGLVGAGERRAALDLSVRILRERKDDSEAVEGAWLDLAALAGDETLSEAALRVLRDSLAESLRDRSKGPAGRTSTLVLAAERVSDSLVAARRDAEAETFLNALRRAATSAKHPLAQRFYQVDWPPKPDIRERDLERIEPTLF